MAQIETGLVKQPMTKDDDPAFRCRKCSRDLVWTRKASYWWCRSCRVLYNPKPNILVTWHCVVVGGLTMKLWWHDSRGVATCEVCAPRVMPAPPGLPWT